MTEATTLRTQEDILARITTIGEQDLFGFAREVLFAALDYEHAQPHLSPGVTAEEWNADARTTQEQVEQAARDYLEFAYGKAEDHRGLSASRSVEKLREYAWLLGRDDVVDAMDAAPYSHYGVPKLLVFARGMEYAEPGPERAKLLRMAAGQPCRPDCEEGCG